MHKGRNKDKIKICKQIKKHNTQESNQKREIEDGEN
jgi:hypothetical protein